MKEHLRIEKFLGLPTIDIDLLPFTILIGQQATGKSIIAKACYFARGIATELFSAIDNNLDKGDFEENLRKKFLSYFPSTCWGEQSFSIQFKTGNAKLSIKKATGKQRKVSIQYPPIFWEKLESARAELNMKRKRGPFEPHERRAAARRIRVKLREDITGEIGESSTFNQLFVPAGRSFFANLQSSIFTFLSSNNAMDPLSLIPLIGNKYSIYIEEPEAHLFPTSQRSILEMIALAFNQKPGMQAMVTTHSPYILTSLNNLIEAGNIFSQGPKLSIRNRVEQIVPKTLALPPGTVGAYHISPYGIESILDEDTGLVNATSIDSASRDIAVKFDELISLQ